MIRTNTVHLARSYICYQIVSLIIGLWIFCIVGDIYGQEQKSNSTKIIGGEIVLDIVQSDERHNVFLVRPTEGNITRFAGAVNPEWSQIRSITPGIRSCDSKPTSVSPDQRFAAECLGTVAPTNVGSKPDHFILRETGSKRILYQGDLPEAIIDSLWSRDSQAIAVLTMTVHVSLNPRYWFYALSGHPMQYETYFLHVIEVPAGNVTTFKVPLEASVSAGYLLAWQEGEKMSGQK
jgi:hypothetical protein